MDRIVEISKIRGESNTVLVNKKKKTVTVKKVDKKGNPLANVEFSVFNYKKDAKENKNVVETKSTDNKGKVTFTLPDYYGVFIKEINAPKGYKISDEIIHVYKDNGVRFIGEKKASDFKVAEAKKGQDLNKYLQSLIRNNTNKNSDGNIDGPNDFNDQIDWLVFNDNEIEKLIPKRTLKYSISWDNIDEAGLVYGNKTVTVDGKTYKIRLMRAYNDTVSVDWIDLNDNWDDGSYEKGSEWNRMILSLIGVYGNTNILGRFDYSTKQLVEQNMAILANYSWEKDFRGGNKRETSERFDDGVSRWMQNTSRFSIWCRAIRGNENKIHKAADSTYDEAKKNLNFFGWLPVLEEVK